MTATLCKWLKNIHLDKYIAKKSRKGSQQMRSQKQKASTRVVWTLDTGKTFGPRAAPPSSILKNCISDAIQIKQKHPNKAKNQEKERFYLFLFYMLPVVDGCLLGFVDTPSPPPQMSI